MRFIDHKNSSKLKYSKLIFLLIFFVNITFCVSCQTKVEKVSTALKKCQDLLDKDELTDIGNCYFEAQKSNPENIAQISRVGEEAILKKCKEFWLSKNYEKSIVCYEGAKAFNQNSSAIWFPLAHSYYEFYKLLQYKDTDLLKKAEEAIKVSLNLNSDDPKSYGLYGSILREREDWLGAEKEYKELLKLDPKAGYFWISLAYVQEKAGKRKEAIKSCQQSLILDPNDIDALYVLGEIYQRNGESIKAIKTFEKLLKIRPNYIDTDKKLQQMKEQQKTERQNKQPENKVKAVGSPVATSN